MGEKSNHSLLCTCVFPSFGFVFCCCCSAFLLLGWVEGGYMLLLLS